MSEHQKPWNETVEPAARRLHLSAQLNLDTVISPDTAAAIALLLRRMALLLDNELEIQSRKSRRSK
jgi:hypothetical protein